MVWHHPWRSAPSPGTSSTAATSLPTRRFHTWRSRLARTTERNDTHVQVNRELLRGVRPVLCTAPWDVALLQECPPRWSAALAAACRAEAQRSLTSRNWLGSVRGALARWNPDLLGSWEGGSNLTLARGPDQGGLVDRRELVLRRRPERRTMAFARLGSGLCVANLHASTSPTRAEPDVRQCRRGGRRLGRRFAADPRRRLQPPPDPARGCSRSSRSASASAHRPAPIPSTTSWAEGSRRSRRPTAWPPEARELPYEGLRLRLSDHAPVEARFTARNGLTHATSGGMR